MRSKWYLATILILLLGLADSIYLTYHYYQINILQPSSKSFCALSKTIDCDKTATSEGSTLIGVPVATWGMFAFFFLLLFIVVERFLYWEIQKALYCFLLLIMYFMAAFSAYEAYISFFILKVVCIMCFALYIVMILMLAFCRQALGISHLEFVVILYDLFFRSFSRKLLRKGASVLIIALVVSGVITFGIDQKFQKDFSYQRVDLLFSLTNIKINK